MHRNLDLLNSWSRLDRLVRPGDIAARFYLRSDTGGAGGGTGGGSGSGGNAGGGEGGGQGGTGGNAGGSGSGGGEGDGAKPKLHTDDDLARIAAREKDEGRRAERAALAEKLGVDPDEAARIIAEHKEAEKAALSAADRAKAEAEEERAAAKREREEAAVATREAKLRLALVTAKVREDRVDSAVRLGLAELPNGDLDAEAYKTTAEKVATTYPEWVGEATTTGGNGNGAPGGLPAGGGAERPKVKGNADGLADAAKRAQEQVAPGTTAKAS